MWAVELEVLLVQQRSKQRNTSQSRHNKPEYCVASTIKKKKELNKPSYCSNSIVALLIGSLFFWINFNPLLRKLGTNLVIFLTRNCQSRWKIIPIKGKMDTVKKSQFSSNVGCRIGGSTSPNKGANRETLRKV